jgi:penicillin-binding protein 1B
MTIEVVSIPDQRRLVFLRRFVRAIQSLISRSAHPKQRLVLRSICGLIAIGLIAGGDALLRSYKYYSRIVDARLASGYPTSRPGLYAAPRLVRPGQNLSRNSLTAALRRAGYVESESSHVWNGSFSETASGIEIRQLRKNRSAPSVVRIHLDGDKITHLTGDELTLESFTLESEVLSNDPSYKAGKRETLTFGEIPPVLVNAILAIEDQRFFEHSGVDPLGIARAMFRNASDERVGQGGSTITQQLVKNTYLSPERTARRKYAEAMLAVALEGRLSKQDIFALYCNEVYLGQRGALAARGVREAAQIYFGKDLKSLSLSEAATLAGMIQGPSRYSPLRHTEIAKARRNTVLNAMVREGFLARKAADNTAKQPVVVSAPSTTDSLAPHFVDMFTASQTRRRTARQNTRGYTQPSI